MGVQKNVPKNEDTKKKIVAFSNTNNELSSVLFKRAPYTAKKKWLKVCQII